VMSVRIWFTSFLLVLRSVT